ncbi:MAG: 5'/3'-nucleotidase SurE [Anaerolinea sp.]
MTRILVTNDDGIDAPGIQALAEAMTEFGDVDIAAPAFNQSATGHKKTLFSIIPIEETQLPNGMPALAVHGSPADCIALCAMGLRPFPPDLIVSGINNGENLSQDITYSGTVTAALEGAIHGVPAVAFSLARRDAHDVADYAEAVRIAKIVVAKVLDQVLPPLTILNVNIPAGVAKGIRVTRQGIRIYRDALEHLEGAVRIVGDPPAGYFDEFGTDLWAVHRGYASMSPIHLDLTAHRYLAELSNWDW